MTKHVHSVDTAVLRRISEHPGDWVFTPADFADLGARTAVASALTRLKTVGTIRTLARGIYDVPRRHALFGELWPSTDAVVAALQRRHGFRVQPAGAYAANLLGLSEQVPAKVIYLTDAKARTLKVGPVQIQLKHTTPRNMRTAERLSGLVIQAFRDLGSSHITPERIERLRKNLPAEKRRQLLDDIALAPAWMRPHFLAIARSGADHE